jgi:hypothetical protein
MSEDAPGADLDALLAPIHAAALRLAQSGLDARAIAECLGVPVESVPALLTVAAVKHARLLRARGSSPP